MLMIKCKKCGSENYRTEPSGPHIKAVCNACGAYIQFLQQGMNGESVMYFGVHKGKKLKDIEPSYFIFLHDNKIASGSLKSYIETNLPAFRQSVHEAQ